MALPTLHPVSEEVITTQTASLGTAPVACHMRAPFRGKILKVGVQQGTAVSGTSVVTVAINGTAVTGGAITVNTGTAGTLFTAAPTGANSVVEDDVVSFTPAGANGVTTVGHCFAVFRRG